MEEKTDEQTEKDFSMFDRLGDLLRQSLDEGKIPGGEKEKKEDNNEKLSPLIDDILNGKEESLKDEENQTDDKDFNLEELLKERLKNCSKKGEKNTSFRSDNSKSFEKKDGEKVKSFFSNKRKKMLDAELERCFRLLDIGPSADFEDVKKAYKEKLHYYHPDKHEGNPVLQKIATDKTRQIMAAYEKLVLFFNLDK